MDAKKALEGIKKFLMGDEKPANENAITEEKPVDDKPVDDKPVEEKPAEENSATSETIETKLEKVKLSIDEIKTLSEKFGAGTVEERVGNLEIMVGALMESCFGWQIDEKERKEAIDVAISTYKNEFEAEKKKQNEGIAKIIELMETFFATPTADPSDKPKESFKKHLAENKNEQISKFQKGFEQLNNNKKV